MVCQVLESWHVAHYRPNYDAAYVSLNALNLPNSRRLFAHFCQTSAGMHGAAGTRPEQFTHVLSDHYQGR